MTTMADDLVVTAQQLATFAGNVNDRRIITEARELALKAGVNPDLVTKISYSHHPPKLPRMNFTLYSVDEDNERVRVFTDTSEFDEELAAAGKPWIYATEDTQLVFRGELPVWWSQAARTVVVTTEELSQE